MLSQKTYAERMREARKAAKTGLGFEDLQVKFRITEKHAFRIVFGHDRHDPRSPAHHKEGQAHAICRGLPECLAAGHQMSPTPLRNALPR